MLKKIIAIILTISTIILITITAKNIKSLIDEKKTAQEVGSTYLQVEEPIDIEEQTEIAEQEEPAEEIVDLEDIEIKEYIDDVMKQHKLNENNFSFFYHNMDNQKYYFYNENKWLTAGSTSKVAIALTYYDKLNSGEISKSKTYKYYDGAYEAGAGTITSKYKVGDNIPVSLLLEQMIVNSDNTATNILCWGLGRQVDYKKQYAKYTDDELTEEFYHKNIITASIGYDFLKYLYENSQDYQELINNMKHSSHGQYLKKYVDCDVAHKYGVYGAYVHDYGIVYGDTTYLIGVYTKGVYNASELISNINKDILSK